MRRLPLWSFRLCCDFRELLLDQHTALFDASFLTCEFAQIVDSCTAHTTKLVNNDVVDEWRIHREDTLNADVVANLAHSETFLVAFAVDFNHNAAVLLNTLLVTLFDAVSNCDCVTWLENRKFFLRSKCLLCNFVYIQYLCNIRGPHFFPPEVTKAVQIYGNFLKLQNFKTISNAN